MKLLSLAEFKALARQQHEFCVSMFMPTHRKAPGIQQDPIRWKNLLRAAEHRLIDAGMGAADAQQLLHPVVELDTDDFWQHQSDGLAIFVAPDWCAYYCLPLSFAAQAIVSNHFHLKPLLPLFAWDDRFYVLALSQHQIRLLQCTRDLATEINLVGLFPSLTQFLRFEEPERQVSAHTGTSGAVASRHGVAGGATVFHGHGAGDENDKENLRLYFCQVDEVISRLLRQDRAPLILAGVEYLVAIYREANTYPQASESELLGNPDSLAPAALQARAWEIVEPELMRAQQEAIAQYHQLAKTAQATDDIYRIVPAAARGQVDRLFVKSNFQQWGRFDPATQRVDLAADPQPEDEELVDFAAIQTILNDGKVYTIDNLPDRPPLAAVFRY